MAQGYKQLLTYKLAQVAFDLGWDSEDHRQRDQIKQALRSHKQNIVEGSAERSLSAKLKLYDVARSSGMEALEDFEDILRLLNLPKWSKNDPRLAKLRLVFESPSSPSNPSVPPVLRVLGISEGQDGLGGREGIEGVVNYLVDILIRNAYLMDRQIDAVEQKHKIEGGYNENLAKRRREYLGNKNSYFKVDN
jgi:four helix bundle suffix protein